MKYYLEVEDNSPYQPKDNWWSSICDVSGMNVYKFDLKHTAEDYMSHADSLEVRLVLHLPRQNPSC